MKHEEIIIDGYMNHLKWTNQSEGEVKHLIAELHGTGENGNDLNKLFNTGLPKALKNNPDFELPNCVIISPQISEGTPSNPITWNQYGQCLKPVFKIWQDFYPTTKLHITGLSGGGGGALKAVIKRWEEQGKHDLSSFACLSGYGSKSEYALDLYHDLPSYFTFGDKPHNNKMEVKTHIVPRLIEMEADITYHLLPDHAHNTWDWAYNVNNELGYFAWFGQKFLEDTEPPIDPEPPQEIKTYEDGLIEGREQMKQDCINAINKL